MSLLDRFTLVRPTYSWVRFHARRAMESGFRVEVRRYGDRVRGAVAVKYVGQDSSISIFTTVASANGQSLWIPIHACDRISESVAAERLTTLSAWDPDLWILSVQVDGPVSEAG